MGKQRRIRYFDWDDRNLEHVGRHGVVQEEVEEIFVGRMYVKRSRDGRYLALGTSGTGRFLFVVFERQEGGGIRPIPARDMSPKERALFRRRSK